MVGRLAHTLVRGKLQKECLPMTNVTFPLRATTRHSEALNLLYFGTRLLICRQLHVYVVYAYIIRTFNA